jgi:hypothetical protein
MNRRTPSLTVICADLHDLLLQASALAMELEGPGQTVPKRRAGLNQVGDRIYRMDQQLVRLRRAVRAHKAALQQGAM